MMGGSSMPKSEYDLVYPASGNVPSSVANVFIYHTALNKDYLVFYIDDIVTKQ